MMMKMIIQCTCQSNNINMVNNCDSFESTKSPSLFKNYVTRVLSDSGASICATGPALPISLKLQVF
jgi:hypothetical protein